jgi:hypothetical protein
MEKKFTKEQSYYLSDNQLYLLDVRGYKGYNLPIDFTSSIQAN